MNHQADLPGLDALQFAVVGLGYVGLPLALALSEHWPVTGLDAAESRIEELRAGKDRTGQVRPAELERARNLSFTPAWKDLASANVFIVAVPTPVTRDKLPDLSALKDASSRIAPLLSPAALVIFESTVYPGATEEICVPILEQASGLALDRDFHVGYSPERINPGDSEHTLQNTVKVTSGSSPAAARLIDSIYRRIVPAGTHLAPSIRVAEAAKAVENTQRDINIAFVNELARMFRRMNLDVHAVLEAAGTKWNFLPFRPGLVGGHCIGVDPYYLVHQSKSHGYEPRLIMAARGVNEAMAAHVVGDVLRLFAENGIDVIGSRALVLGIAFKPNCPDLRNTQVAGIVRGLEKCGAAVDVMDPHVDAAECGSELGIDLLESPRGRYALVLLAVPHEEFRNLDAEYLAGITADRHLLYDIGTHLPELPSLRRM